MCLEEEKRAWVDRARQQKEAEKRLDLQREAEALRQTGHDPWKAITVAARLAREGWSPPLPHEHRARFDSGVHLSDDSFYRIDKCDCGAIRISYGEWIEGCPSKPVPGGWPIY